MAVERVDQRDGCSRLCAAWEVRGSAAAQAGVCAGAMLRWRGEAWAARRRETCVAGRAWRGGACVARHAWRGVGCVGCEAGVAAGRGMNCEACVPRRSEARGGVNCGASRGVLGVASQGVLGVAGVGVALAVAWRGPGVAWRARRAWGGGGTWREPRGVRGRGEAGARGAAYEARRGVNCVASRGALGVGVGVACVAWRTRRRGEACVARREWPAWRGPTRRGEARAGSGGEGGVCRALFHVEHPVAAQVQP
jgi:hypothetical protein